MANFGRPMRAAPTLQPAMVALAAVLVAGTVGCSSDEPYYPWEQYLDIPGLHAPYDTDDVLEALAAARTDPYRLVLADPIDDATQTRRDELVAYADALIRDGYALRDNPVIDITRPIDWGRNPDGDSNWHFQLNALRPIEPVFGAFAVTGHEPYRVVAMGAVLDWIHYNIECGRDNAMKWYDMATGIRAVYVMDTLDWELRSDSPDPNRVFELVRAAKKHMDVLRDPDRFADDNHGLFMMLGLRALVARIPELRGAESAADYNEERLDALLDQQFSSELIHMEHSPSYHVFIGQTLSRFARTGLFDDTSNLVDVARGAESHYHELLHPNGDVVNVGDSGGAGYGGLTPYTRYLESDGASGERPDDVDGYFPEAGIAILRSPWSASPPSQHSYLYFSAAFHSTTHMHADPLTFEWSELGTPIVVDSGKYVYGSDSWREFFTSTRAGNTVEIDSRSFDTEQRPFGSALTGHGQLDDDLRWVEAQMYRERSDVDHTRMLVVRAGRWLLVIDRIESLEQHLYRQWFGFHEDIDVEELAGAFRAELPDDRGAVYLQELDANAPEERVLVRGEEGDRPQGWISRDYLEKQPRFSAAFARRGSSTDFVTLLSLSEPVTDAQVERDGDTLVISFGTGTGTRETLVYTPGNGAPASSVSRVAVTNDD